MNRRTPFANEQYYHIYNRGVDKRDIFLSMEDYERFILSMILLNDDNDGLMIFWRDYQKANPKVKLSDFLKFNFRKGALVEINCFCLNPNHYHFILKQILDRGIERFMQKIGTSYTKYFNKKNNRSGSLFQGTFKSVHIDSNEYLLHLSAYINKNNFIHKYSNNENWKYSSLNEYRNYYNAGQINLCNTSPVLSQFKNVGEYLEFLKINAQYLKEKKENQKYLLE